MTPDALLAPATFSPDRRHRFSLVRELDPVLGGQRTIAFVACNPSTADERHDDPTVRRMIRFAQRWGFARLLLGNIFSLRSTNPAALYEDDRADGGSPNDATILRLAAAADLVVCAWGTHGALRDRGIAVAGMLRDAGLKLHHLGLNQDGSPKHPLYLPGHLEPQPWEGPC
jgi:hypothetical protein